MKWLLLYFSIASAFIHKLIVHDSSSVAYWSHDNHIGILHTHHHRLPKKYILQDIDAVSAEQLLLSFYHDEKHHLGIYSFRQSCLFPILNSNIPFFCIGYMKSIIYCLQINGHLHLVDSASNISHDEHIPFFISSVNHHVNVPFLFFGDFQGQLHILNVQTKKWSSPMSIFNSPVTSIHISEFDDHIFLTCSSHDGECVLLSFTCPVMCLVFERFKFKNVDSAIGHPFVLVTTFRNHQVGIYHASVDFLPYPSTVLALKNDIVWFLHNATLHQKVIPNLKHEF